MVVLAFCSNTRCIKCICYLLSSEPPATCPALLHSCLQEHPLDQRLLCIDGSLPLVSFLHMKQCIQPMLHFLLPLQFTPLSPLAVFPTALDLHVSFELQFVQCMMQMCEFQILMLISILVFLRPLYCFPQWLPSYLPTNSVGRFASLYTLYSIYYIICFVNIFFKEFMWGKNKEASTLEPDPVFTFLHSSQSH